MTNKAVFALLVLILLASLGVAYYTYTLSREIDILQAQLVAIGQAQDQRSEELGNSITALSDKTTAGLNALSGELSATEETISTLENGLDNARNIIDSMQQEVARTGSEVTDLRSDLDRLSGMSGSVINAERIFQEASQAVVRISNGEQTIGSGFLYNDSGHVATAFHVIEDLGRIYVIFPDGRVSLVTGTAGSRESDVAVLTITNRPDFEPSPVADSDETHIGEPVVAIGNPFDLTDSITAGIVSQVNRFAEIGTGLNSRRVANLIQFDAPANPGNSGCPLFNAQGEVVGMVIARIQPGEGDGIYYAVSANKLRKVADTLIASGFFAYPWIGVNITDLTPEIVQDRGLDSIYGALVQAVSPDSPAEAAGIKVNDIIVGMDGFMMQSVADVTSYLGEHRTPGEEATVQLIRNGNELTLPLTVGTVSP